MRDLSAKALYLLLSPVIIPVFLLIAVVYGFFWLLIAGAHRVLLYLTGLYEKGGILIEDYILNN